VVEPAVLTIEDERDGDACTLRLRGELDMAAVPALDATVRRVLEGAISALTLDLGELSFIDSTGLAAIVHAGSLCDSAEIAFELLPGPRAVQRLFEVTGLDGVLPFGEPAPRSD